MWGVKLYLALQQEGWLLFPETSEKSLVLLQILYVASVLARIYAVDMEVVSAQVALARKDIQEVIVQLHVIYHVINVVAQNLKPVPHAGQEHRCLMKPVFAIKD